MSESQAAPFAVGRIGRRSGAPGVFVTEVRGMRLLSLLARRGAAERLSERAAREFGTPLPLSPLVATGRGAAFVWSGPDHWLVEVREHELRLDERLVSAFADLAAVVEQSDSRVLLDLTGPRIRDALAKGLPIDLDPAAFGVGHAAVTAVAHVGVHIWQISAAPVYRLAVPRSYFASFWHWLASSAAEFGCEIAAPG